MAIVLVCSNNSQLLNTRTGDVVKIVTRDA
jgi:hypothetical protein